METKFKALEDERARRSTEDALVALRRHLNRLLNMFDRYEAVELLQSLVRLARNEAHHKADEYAAALDKVRASADNWTGRLCRGFSLAFWLTLFVPR